MVMLLTCGTVFAKENSPEWIKNLDDAKNSNQMFVIAGINQTTAWVLVHSNILREMGNKL